MDVSVHTDGSFEDRYGSDVYWAGTYSFSTPKDLKLSDGTNTVAVTLNTDGKIAGSINPIRRLIIRAIHVGKKSLDTFSHTFRARIPSCRTWCGCWLAFGTNCSTGRRNNVSSRTPLRGGESCSTRATRRRACGSASEVLCKLWRRACGCCTTRPRNAYWSASARRWKSQRQMATVR